MIKNFVAVRHREPIWQWPWTRMKKEAVGGRSAMPHPGAEKRKLFSQVQEQLSKPRITSNGFIYPNNIGDRAQVGRDKYCFIPSIKIPPQRNKRKQQVVVVGPLQFGRLWAPSVACLKFSFHRPATPSFFYLLFYDLFSTVSDLFSTNKNLI